MNARFIRLLALLMMTLVPVPGLIGCATYRGLSESAFMMAPADEAQLGTNFKQELDKELKYVNDPTITSYVSELSQRVWAASPESDFELKTYVIEDPSINAFAIPGGSIFVNTGLLQAADDEAELAGVIAHEIGHVVRRHSARAVARNTGVDLTTDLASQILLGEEAAQQWSSVIKTGAGLGLLSYTREDEAEADRVAVNTMYKTGYDPKAMADFFGKLIDTYGDRGAMATWFASHPATGERVRTVNMLADQLPERKYQRPVTELRKIQGRLTELGYTAE